MTRASAKRGEGRAPGDGPGLFQVAVSILNGEVRFPREPSSPKPRRHKGRIATEAHEEPAASSQSRSPEDEDEQLCAARGAIATFILWSAVLHAKRFRIRDRFLPEAMSAWDADPWVAPGWQHEEPSSEVKNAIRYASGLVFDARKWPGYYDGPTMSHYVALFGRVPATAAEAEVAVTLAFALNFGGYTREQLSVCAACGRFFVTARADAFTCSDACRARRSRVTRPDREKVKAGRRKGTRAEGNSRSRRQPVAG